MSRTSTRRWRTAAAAAGLAMAAAAVPAVAAAAAASPVTYYACVTTSTGTVKIVSKSTTCGTGQHKISWNNTGPIGPVGPPGPQGATGPQGPPSATDVYVDNGVVGLLSNSFVTTVGALRLPSGSFLVTAQASLAMNGGESNSDTVVCWLDGNGVPLTEYVPDTLIWDSTGNAYGNIPLTAISTTGGTVTLQCDDYNAQAYVSSAVLTAIPVATIIDDSTRAAPHPLPAHPAGPAGPGHTR